MQSFILIRTLSSTAEPWRYWQFLDDGPWGNALLVALLAMWLVVLPIANIVLAWRMGWRPVTVSGKGCASLMVLFSPLMFVFLIVAYFLENTQRKKHV